MDKKQYILAILDSLQNERPLASGLKYLLENGSLDEKTIDMLINIFREAIKNVNEENEKNKYKKSLEMLEKIKKAEMDYHEKDSNLDRNLDKAINENG